VEGKNMGLVNNGGLAGVDCDTDLLAHHAE
jgi:hypothetical protein